MLQPLSFSSLGVQGAIDVANPGDAVFVFNGTYYENVRVNRSLFLGWRGQKLDNN